MNNRTDTIPLPPDEPRCLPANPGQCRVRGHCARYQAALPKSGAKLQDFTVDVIGNPTFGSYLCAGFVSSAALRAQAKPAPQARKFGAVKGIA